MPHQQQQQQQSPLDQYNSMIKVIDDLSGKITQKTEELETYKLNYSRKIEQLDSLLRELSPDLRFDDASLIRGNQELKLTHEGGKDIWRDETGQEYIVVPVSRRELVNTTPTSSQETQIDLTPVPKPSMIEINSGKRKKDKKKTCSYCHENGHNRATCPKKLY